MAPQLAATFTRALEGYGDALIKRSGVEGAFGVIGTHIQDYFQIDKLSRRLSDHAESIAAFFESQNFLHIHISGVPPQPQPRVPTVEEPVRAESSNATAEEQSEASNLRRSPRAAVTVA